MPGCGVTCDPRNDECRCVPCQPCGGTGEWETECCNGSGGCTCRGLPVPMGACNVCRGYGRHQPGVNLRANVDAIAGYHFIGSGPAGMHRLWPSRMGRQGAVR